MDDLFIRPDGTPLLFYLADLEPHVERNYTLRIEDYGGKVEEVPNEKVLTFTTQSKKMNYEFVFDVKFIDDCIERQKILDVNLYFIGDKRHNNGCVMTKLAIKNKQCLYNSINYNKLCKFLRNNELPRYGCLKSTTSKENRLTKSASISKKNKVEQLNIEKSNMLKQTTLSPFTLNNNNNQNKLSETNIIRETDSEEEQDEIPDSPVRKTNVSVKKSKRKEPSILKNILLEPSTSKRKKIVYTEVDLTSESDEIDENKQKEAKIITKTEIDENKEPKTRNRKHLKNNISPTKNHIPENKRKLSEGNSDTEYQDSDSSPERESHAGKWNITNNLQLFVQHTIADKKLDEFGYPISNGLIFESSEVKAILKFLLISDKVSQAAELDTWKKAYELKFLPRKRTPHVLLDYFMQVILPNIENYNLKDEHLVKFRTVKMPKEVTRKNTDIQENDSEYRDSESDSETQEMELANKVNTFVKETIKGKKLDNDGYPHSYAKIFQDWETQAMIKYLLISDNVSEAREIDTWRKAFKLKFLPKKRSATSMARYFKRVILPNIDSYYLSKKDLAKFLALNPPKAIVKED